MSVKCDIAVLGATAAGYAAAHSLAKAGFAVTVVGAPSREVQCPLTDWAPADVFRLKGMPGALLTAAKAQEFRRVVYHNADFTKQAEHKSRTAAGYFVASDALGKAFKAAATKAGAKVRTSRSTPGIHLEEDSIRLEMSTPLTARLLIVAHDRPSEIVAQLGLPIRNVPQSPLVAAGLDIPLPGRRRGANPHAGAMHVLAAREHSEMGMAYLAGSTAHVRVISTSAAYGTRTAELSGMVASLQEAGILPREQALTKAKGAVWRPPAGVALDLESHVAKRCLLVGTAGGFVDSITGQVLAPSMRSALLAAEAAAGALKSKNVQDSLMKFRTTWRNKLADSLRPPNTSLQMLLPLVFVNERIVGKFTRALLYGEAI